MGNCCSEQTFANPLLENSVKMGGDGRIKDHYRLIGQPLGSGRMASVRLGIDKKSGKEIAVKICSKRMLESRPPRISRTSEIEALQRVWSGKSPCEHIIELYATFEDKNYIYLVTEYAEGGDLFHYLAFKETFSEEDVAIIGRQLLEAVSHCHSKGVIHRDLKPANIMLSDPISLNIKVVDFGSAALFDGPNERFGDFMCTPFYAAPEVWKHCYGCEADVWSVGAILYVLLTGLPPSLNSKNVHSNSTWRDLQAGIVNGLPEKTSPALLDFLEKLLHPLPSERITAAQALQHPWITGEAARGKDNLEASIKNFRAYAKIRKFQKAALLLLSVSASQKQLNKLVLKVLSNDYEHTISETEMEHLLLSCGMSKQATKLKQLRESMLGINFLEESSLIDFLTEELAEISNCHQRLLHQSKSSKDFQLLNGSNTVLTQKKLTHKSSSMNDIHSLQFKSKNVSEINSVSESSVFPTLKSSNSPIHDNSLPEDVTETSSTVHGEMLYQRFANID